jgi:hypothetical protein
MSYHYVVVLNDRDKVKRVLGLDSQQEAVETADLTNRWSDAMVGTGYREPLYAYVYESRSPKRKVALREFLEEHNLVKV